MPPDESSASPSTPLPSESPGAACLPPQTPAPRRSEENERAFPGDSFPAAYPGLHRGRRAAKESGYSVGLHSTGAGGLTTREPSRRRTAPDFSLPSQEAGRGESVAGSVVRRAFRKRRWRTASEIDTPSLSFLVPPRCQFDHLAACQHESAHRIFMGLVGASGRRFFTDRLH